MADFKGKMFVRFSGTKAQFIAQIVDKGLEPLYTNKIVFIGEGKDSCVYTHGQYFADANAALASLKYFAGVRVGSGNPAMATAPNLILTFNSKDDSIFEVAAGADGITIGLSDAFVDKIDNKADASALIPLTNADTELDRRITAVEESVGTGGSVDGKISAAIAGLNVDESTGDYVKTIKQEGGRIVATTGTFNFETAGAAGLAKSQVIGTADDASSAETIYGAKKYADEKAAAAKSAAEATASSDATAKADQALADAKTHVGQEIAKLSADVTSAEADHKVRVQVVEEGGKITAVNVTESDIASAAILAQVKADVDDFFRDALGDSDAQNVKDTLREIQDYINSDVEGAAGMASSIQEAKNAADAAQEAADKAQGEVDALELIVESVKTTANAAATQDALNTEIERADKAEKANAAAIKAIADDYLKEADRTDLEGLIDNKVAQSTYDSKVQDLEDAIDTAESNANTYTDNKIIGLKKTDAAVDGEYVTSVSQENGVITVNRAPLPVDTLVSGDNNGTVKFNGAEVAVKGLSSAAYTESSAYATAVQGATADAAKTKADANEALIKGLNLATVSGYIKSVGQVEGLVTATKVDAIPAQDIAVADNGNKLTSATVEDALAELASFWDWEEVEVLS